MKILYVAMKYDYGRPEQGLSFEHHNFYESLAAEGHELVYFDFKTLHDALGRDEMNRRLLATAKAENADLMFTCLFTEELDPEVVRTITRELPTITLNWFCDDHWRFEDFSARWAPCFDWVVTTASSAVPKYARIGYPTAIKSQWACNHHLYRKLELSPRYDVSFVGQPHGNRPAVIAALRDAGIDIRTWGGGWPEGRITQEEMIRVFNESRINLNLPNASSSGGALGWTTPDARCAWTHCPWRCQGGGRVLNGSSPAAGDRAGGADRLAPEQIKARAISRRPGVRWLPAHVVPQTKPRHGRTYEPGREIEVFNGIDDLTGGGEGPLLP